MYPLSSQENNKKTLHHGFSPCISVFFHYPTDNYTSSENLFNYHSVVSNLHAQSDFEIVDSLTQSKPNVQDLSQGTTQQQLAMFKQQITTFEAVLGASTQTPSSGISTTLSMYSENPITLFFNLSSTYVSGSVAQTTGFSTWEKLNGQNYLGRLNWLLQLEVVIVYRL